MLMTPWSASAAPATSTLSPSAQAALTPSMATKLAQHVDKKVIVILKSQLAPAHVGTSAAKQRSTKIKSVQAPVVSELKQVSATHIKTFTTSNIVSATVSAAEQSRLSADPAVAEVIPDSVIHLAAPATTPTSSGYPTSSALTPNDIPGACGANGAVQLDPEALSLMHVDSDDPHAATARSLGFTGTGVKVAYIADGIDPSNVNFLRNPNDPTSSAFTDTEDFTGDGPGQPTTGGEAFLDANSIAGQGKHVYDVQNFSAQPTAAACNIRIEGVAPGASLVGLNVFGENELTTESNFLQAIDYAVQTEHVNILNESFGTNAFPDVRTLDVTDQFDEAAVAAGVTVTVSSGDAGSTNTIGSPATDPAVISVGASTDLRFYAQTDYADARYFAKNGWLNNNISSLSSGGTNETGGTINLVAPGELSFASCDASTTYADCTDFKGNPSDVEESGGTSESAPFTAGTAALVIQAYGKTHGGAVPTPALVKQILVSTATDLGAPATEQGAGLVNAYKAVQLAGTIQKPVTRTSSQDASLVKSAVSLQATSTPSARESLPVTVTNSGSRPQLVGVSTRAIGPDQNVQTGSVTLSDTASPQIIGFQGLPNNYEKFTFTVKPGQNRLDASLAYPGDPALGNNQRVRMDLIDPTGKFAAHSFAQGVGNYGNSDVVNPTPGTWTGYVFGLTTKDSGTNGKVVWRTATQKYVPFGSVSNPTLLLGAGQSKTIRVTETTPSSPGDSSGSVVFTSKAGTTGVSTIPVTLRSTIDVAHGGRFSGTLTGGNGRPNGQGQEQYYEFSVPRGVHNITASTTLANDAENPIGEYLVSPDGNTLGYGQNSTEGTSTLSATAWTVDPTPGVWTLIVDFASPVVGNEVSDPYTGSVAFNAAKASAPGLPTGGKLAAGKAVTVPVTITNNGKAPEDFFVDPRLNTSAILPLTGLDQTSGLALPLTTSEPEWFVPTQSSGLGITATSSLPIEFDAGLFQGDPDLGSTPTAESTGSLCATSESLSYTPTGGKVGAGGWFAAPTECGPYAAPATPGTADIQASVVTKPFDAAVTSTTGDFEELAVNPNDENLAPVVIAPGASAVVKVTITPRGASGTKVNGTLYVDDYVNAVPPYGQTSTDELFGLPYSYTIK
ncbi:hypothetical protein AX769_16370 [Frondihabitans sp. PAMC 28766]|uniref:S8 family peptidase n=1 Tax=Frondihabitans sp. PAMC 28766 TaxID=1795630 RepID=UPI00078BF902|nr:hypothetical protein [Frondihabitans sp. PAMC 28766]AMM21417.1 hypothetical protein AX769_16370 [Frondihabitans sp. PAMC 28766]